MIYKVQRGYNNVIQGCTAVANTLIWSLLWSCLRKRRKGKREEKRWEKQEIRRLCPRFERGRKERSWSLPDSLGRIICDSITGIYKLLLHCDVKFVILMKDDPAVMVGLLIASLNFRPIKSPKYFIYPKPRDFGSLAWSRFCFRKETLKSCLSVEEGILLNVMQRKEGEWRQLAGCR